MIDAAADHIPVLRDEVLEYLAVQPGQTLVDCTVGLGGHAEAILEALQGSGMLIAIDRDLEALKAAKERLGRKYPQASFYHENFKNLPLILTRLGIRAVDGCLLDLGVSSRQLDSPERGFSFRSEGPLDMRMDSEQRTTAADLLSQLSEEELAEIFRKHGEERSAKRIAAAIVKERKKGPIRTTTQLADLVVRVKGKGSGRIHPATKVFQALRIEVNQELAGLGSFLNQIILRLRKGGRLVTIAFHSLEDRIVKRCFQKAAGRCVCFRPDPLCTCPRKVLVRILTRKPVTAGPEESRRNPRSRSAKLRAVEKTAVSEFEMNGKE
ncbi:MAG TPA: 16S rRNA (cytosine(1402)-N(4))-methyltransferase RsmH [Acidobacteriota bacterium]|nr:16S rRNA (cytosine(1402)-N(4))-methyltransferase RsmH [Acidobacteriota bacterium]